MTLSGNAAVLGLIAMLALVSRTSASDENSHLQTEMQKRIFCNFFGCGSKRSQPSSIQPKFTGSSLQNHLELPESSSEYSEMLDGVAKRPSYYGGAFTGQSLLRDGGNFGGSRVSPSQLRRSQFAKAAALWDALQGRVQAKPHRLHRRDVSGGDA